MTDIDRGISEFGQRLGDYLAADPARRGAVLTDDDGHPVDYACRSAQLSPLEIQLVGAQCERALADLEPLGLDELVLCLRASGGHLLTRALSRGYVLAALHDPDAASAHHDAFLELGARIELLLF